MIGSLEPEDIERLSESHDLMVVCSGRGALTSMFPRRPEKSPYDRPSVGCAQASTTGLPAPTPSASRSPSHLATASCSSCRCSRATGTSPSSCSSAFRAAAWSRWPTCATTTTPTAFLQAVQSTLEELHPKTFERLDPSEFALTGPLDILQGALTPTVREDYIQLASGKFAIAVGDVHTVVDPVMGQGANSASYSAWTVGEAIVADYVYDERFCQRVARAREARVLGISDWVNFMLAPPAPHLLDLVVAMAQNKAICDEFTENFSYPERQWDILATPERTKAFLARHAAAASPISTESAASGDDAQRLLDAPERHPVQGSGGDDLAGE